MESPEHQRRMIVDYYLSESPEGTEVRHAEKVASEAIYGFRHDVWDVDASDGRWWVITNPTNLYPQETAPTPSMDHALALHIGVTARMIAHGRMRAPVDGPPRDFLARAWRKFEQAAEALNDATEADDFQAVGMRCRECLISFAQEAAGQATIPEGTEPPKRSDFKGWAALLAPVAAPGSHGKQMRNFLRALSRETWDLASWLTHAADGTRGDAEAAVDATGHLLGTFSLALIRAQRGDPPRCPDCGSYRVTVDFRGFEDDDFSRPLEYNLCEACGWEEPTGRVSTPG